jgi:hypothetical protein
MLDWRFVRHHVGHLECRVAAHKRFDGLSTIPLRTWPYTSYHGTVTRLLSCHSNTDAVFQSILSRWPGEILLIWLMPPASRA